MRSIFEEVCAVLVFAALLAGFLFAFDRALEIEEREARRSEAVRMAEARR